MPERLSGRARHRMQRILLSAALLSGIAGVLASGVASAGESRRGYLVDEVAAGMPAARAGIRAGDRITAVDGRPVHSDDDIARAVATGGRAVTVEIERDGRRVRLRITPRQTTRAERETYVVRHPDRRTIGLVHTEFGLPFGTGANDYIPPPPIPPDPVIPPPPPPTNW